MPYENVSYPIIHRPNSHIAEVQWPSRANTLMQYPVVVRSQSRMGVPLILSVRLLAWPLLLSVVAPWAILLLDLVMCFCLFALLVAHWVYFVFLDLSWLFGPYWWELLQKQTEKGKPQFATMMSPSRQFDINRKHEVYFKPTAKVAGEEERTELKLNKGAGSFAALVPFTTLTSLKHAKVLW